MCTFQGQGPADYELYFESQPAASSLGATIAVVVCLRKPIVLVGTREVKHTFDPITWVLLPGFSVERVT
eukprot:7377276-Prymnesium_polylepis.1